MSNQSIVEQASGPVRSEYIRISDRKAIVIKLWGTGPSKFSDSIIPANLEIEEITYPADGGEPTYGPSIRLPGRSESFMLLSYVEDYLKEARYLNRKARSQA